MMVDQFGELAHLHARDTSLALVSIASIANIEAYRKRMGWSIPWYSSAGSTFNRDFGRTTDKGEMFGLSVFVRDDEHHVAEDLLSWIGDRQILIDGQPDDEDRKWADPGQRRSGGGGRG